MVSKVWFITGSSRGFGRIWVEAALARGDKVAATARDVSSLKDLVETYGDAIAAIKLDVNDKKAVDSAIAEAHQRFGRLDVVINNAGYGHFGAIEEITEAEARAQIETNVFGALWVTQAALPIMRKQGSGHIYPDFVDRRRQRFFQSRALPCLQMGAGRLQPGAGARSGGVRRPCDAGRARRLLDGLERPLRQTQHPDRSL